MFNPKFQQSRQGDASGSRPFHHDPGFRDIYRPNNSYSDRQATQPIRDGPSHNRSNSSVTYTPGYQYARSGSSTAILCRFYKEGKCTNTKCRFKHESGDEKKEETTSNNRDLSASKSEVKGSDSSKTAVVEPQQKEDKQVRSEISSSTQSEEKKAVDEDVSPFYCENCLIDCKTLKVYQNHIRGMLHTQKVMGNSKGAENVQPQAKPPQTPPKQQQEVVPQQQEVVPQQQEVVPQQQEVAPVAITTPSLTTPRTSPAQIKPSPGGSEGEDYYCSVCQLYCTNSKAYQNHTRGLIHTQKVIEMEKNEGNALVPEEDIEEMEVGDGMEKTLQGTYMASVVEKDIVNTYMCEVCDCSMNGVSSWNAHMEGARHAKNLKNRATGARIKRGRTSKTGPVETEPGVAQAQAFLDACTQPLIGLQHITEFTVESVAVDPRYVCNMCERKCDLNSLIPHCTGSKHRLNYMKEHFMNYYSAVRHKNIRRAELTSIVEHYTKLIVREEGKTFIKQKLIDDATLLDKNAKNMLTLTNTDKDSVPDLTKQGPPPGAFVFTKEEALGVPTKRQKLDIQEDAYSEDLNDLSELAGGDSRGLGRVSGDDLLPQRYPRDVLREGATSRHLEPAFYRPHPSDDSYLDDYYRDRLRRAEVSASELRAPAYDRLARVSEDTPNKDLLAVRDALDVYGEWRREKVARKPDDPYRERLGAAAAGGSAYLRPDLDPYGRREIPAVPDRDPYAASREALSSYPDPRSVHQRDGRLAGDPYTSAERPLPLSDPGARGLLTDPHGVVGRTRDPVDPYSRGRELPAREPSRRDDAAATRAPMRGSWFVPPAGKAVDDRYDRYTRTLQQLYEREKQTMPEQMARGGGTSESSLTGPQNTTNPGSQAGGGPVMSDTVTQRDSEPGYRGRYADSGGRLSSAGFGDDHAGLRNSVLGDNGRNVSEGNYRNSASDSNNMLGRGLPTEGQAVPSQGMMHEAPPRMGFDELQNGQGQGSNTAMESINSGGGQSMYGGGQFGQPSRESTASRKSLLGAGPGMPDDRCNYSAPAPHGGGQEQGGGVGQTRATNAVPDGGLNVGHGFHGQGGGTEAPFDLQRGDRWGGEGSLQPPPLMACDPHLKAPGFSNSGTRGDVQGMSGGTKGGRLLAMPPPPSSSSMEQMNFGGEMSQQEPQQQQSQMMGGSEIVNVINNLSQCLVNNEEDASMALQVSNALTQALIQYRIKNTPQGIPPPGM